MSLHRTPVCVIMMTLDQRYIYIYSSANWWTSALTASKPAQCWAYYHNDMPCRWRWLCSVSVGCQTFASVHTTHTHSALCIAVACLPSLLSIADQYFPFPGKTLTQLHTLTGAGYTAWALFWLDVWRSTVYLDPNKQPLPAPQLLQPAITSYRRISLFGSSPTTGLLPVLE